MPEAGAANGRSTGMGSTMYSGESTKSILRTEKLSWFSITVGGKENIWTLPHLKSSRLTGGLVRWHWFPPTDLSNDILSSLSILGRLDGVLHSFASIQGNSTSHKGFRFTCSPDSVGPSCASHFFNVCRTFRRNLPFYICNCSKQYTCYDFLLGCLYVSSPLLSSMLLWIGNYYCDKTFLVLYERASCVILTMWIPNTRN